jgi:hypothetical protein
MSNQFPPSQLPPAYLNKNQPLYLPFDTNLFPSTDLVVSTLGVNGLGRIGLFPFNSNTSADVVFQTDSNAIAIRAYPDSTGLPEFAVQDFQANTYERVGASQLTLYNNALLPIAPYAVLTDNGGQDNLLISSSAVTINNLLLSTINGAPYNSSFVIPTNPTFNSVNINYNGSLRLLPNSNFAPTKANIVFGSTWSPASSIIMQLEEINYAGSGNFEMVKMFTSTNKMTGLGIGDLQIYGNGNTQGSGVAPYGIITNNGTIGMALQSPLVSISSLNVSTINGLPYGGGGGTISTFSTIFSQFGGFSTLSTTNITAQFGAFSTLSTTNITGQFGAFSTLSTINTIGQFASYSTIFAQTGIFSSLSASNIVDLTSTGITINNGYISSLTNNFLSSILVIAGSNLTTPKITLTDNFKPQFNVDLGMGNFLGGLVGGAASGVFNTILGGVALATGAMALVNTRANNSNSPNFNSTNYEMIAGTTQLQISTLGQATSTITRLVSSINPNQTPGLEIYISSIIPINATCIRSLSDPIYLANASSATSSILAYGQWQELPLYVPGTIPSNLVLSTLIANNSITVGPASAGRVPQFVLSPSTFGFYGLSNEQSAVFQYDNIFNGIMNFGTFDTINGGTGFEIDSQGSIINLNSQQNNFGSGSNIFNGIANFTSTTTFTEVTLFNSYVGFNNIVNMNAPLNVNSVATFSNTAYHPVVIYGSPQPRTLQTSMNCSRQTSFVATSAPLALGTSGSICAYSFTGQWAQQNAVRVTLCGNSSTTYSTNSTPFGVNNYYTIYVVNSFTGTPNVVWCVIEGDKGSPTNGTYLAVDASETISYTCTSLINGGGTRQWPNQTATLQEQPFNWPISFVLNPQVTPTFSIWANLNNGSANIDLSGFVINIKLEAIF